MSLKSEWEIQLLRSKRKTLSMSVGKQGEIIVRAPLKLSVTQIEAFVEKHKEWLKKQKAKRQKQLERSLEGTDVLSPAEVERLKSLAKSILPSRVDYYSHIMGVEATGIKITAAKTRWGSCSGKNSLCFPYRLMLLQPQLIDCIVVHELAHIRVKNHSAKFYSEVLKYLPSYREDMKKLKLLQEELPF